MPEPTTLNTLPGTNGKRPTPKAVMTKRLSGSGLKRVGGYINEEFLPELRFPWGLRVYEEMRKNSGTIGGLLRAIKASFRSVRWFMAPADDSPEAAANAAFAESCRNDMKRPHSSFTNDAITFLPFGFSAMEMWFKHRNGRKGDPRSKYVDGKIGFADIALIGHDSIMEWVYDPLNPTELIGLAQIAPPTFQRVIIPREKFLLFRTETEKDNPEGASILREAYYDYSSMMGIEAVEKISLERTGAGVPVATLEKGASTRAEAPGASDEEAAEQLVRSVRVDEQGGVIETQFVKFRLERPNGRVDPQLFDLAIRRHRSGMLMSVLAVFLELGTSRVGSFALAEQGRGFFEVAFEGYVNAYEDTYNEEAIPLLFELNGVHDALPKLTHTTIAGSNVLAIVQAVEKLTDKGYLNAEDPLIRSYVKDLLRLPRGDTVKELEDYTPDEPSPNGKGPIEEPDGDAEDDDEEDENGNAEDDLPPLERRPLSRRA